MPVWCRFTGMPWWILAGWCPRLFRSCSTDSSCPSGYEEDSSAECYHDCDRKICGVPVAIDMLIMRPPAPLSSRILSDVEWLMDKFNLDLFLWLHGWAVVQLPETFTVDSLNANIDMITLPTVFEARLLAFWSVPPKVSAERSSKMRRHSSVGCTST